MSDWAAGKIWEATATTGAVTAAAYLHYFAFACSLDPEQSKIWAMFPSCVITLKMNFLGGMYLICWFLNALVSWSSSFSFGSPAAVEKYLRAGLYAFANIL